MSDPLKHECGIAVVRLKKPLAYYQDKHGSALYGFNKLFLLMEKQHNRGQDGVGIGCCKLDSELGQPYLFRDRSTKTDALARVFRGQMKRYDRLASSGDIDEDDPVSIKRGFDFAGEVLIGHLRYGTSGLFSTAACHPYVRRSNWQTRSLMVAGNFNMTNAAFLNEKLIRRGQHPVFDTDTQTVLEEIGYHLDEEHSEIYHELKDEGMEQSLIPGVISKRLRLEDVVRPAAEIWDGGYAIAGVVGNGDTFVMRDPNGIRPCFYFEDDEVIAFASERVPLMTIFDKQKDEVQELPPGHVAVIKNDAPTVELSRFAEERPPKCCSFERIYFSRGNDPEIYKERLALGAALVPQLVESIDNEIANTVFSFVPNTAEVAYHGMMRGLREHRRAEVSAALKAKLAAGELNAQEIDEMVLGGWPVGEKIAHKDIKLRTFISQESGRKQLVSHVYDITYGVVDPGDNLVVIDDSIVRGTTLRQSILKILARTDPKRIVIASTAPQIRYPDCYGIDMAELSKFIAFQAAVDLLKGSGRAAVLDQVYEAAKAELTKPVNEMQNAVKAIYEPFSPEEISGRIAQIVYPEDIPWKGEVIVVYQGIQALHDALPDHLGDWYFTGDYPTSGGFAVVNQAFIHYYEKRDGRAYDLFFEPGELDAATPSPSTP